MYVVECCGTHVLMDVVRKVLFDVLFYMFYVHGFTGCLIVS